MIRVPSRLSAARAAVLVGACLAAAPAPHALLAQTVTVAVDDCPAGMYEFRFNGVSFDTVAALAPGAENGTYTLANDGEAPRIAYLGPLTGSPAIPVLLDGAETFRVSGPCGQMTSAVVTGSPANESYKQLKAEMVADAQAAQAITQRLGAMPADAPDYARLKDELAASDAGRLAKLTALRESGNAFGASVLAANLYTSFANTQKGYGSELTYFINERFQHADFSQPIYVGNPWVFEGFRDYAGALVSAQLPAEMLAESLNGQLDLVYNNRPVHKLALGGVIATLKSAQNTLAADFAKQYLKRFGEEEPMAAAILEEDVRQLGAMSTGALAPEFAQASLDGSGELGPQDFRGKVLLIDFWASWCGPCRRENPNVVRMYDEFKDAGFEILGVSLDKSAAPWQKAVEKDGLTWAHVSDLRGWANAAAQLYGVRSIPATVLLDREGNIVARDLRGAALHAKVAELVGQAGG